MSDEDELARTVARGATEVDGSTIDPEGEPGGGVDRDANLTRSRDIDLRASESDFANLRPGTRHGTDLDDREFRKRQ